MGAWQGRSGRRTFNSLFVFRLFLDDGHVDLYLEYPTYPSRVSGRESIIEEVGQATGVKGQFAIRESHDVVDPAVNEVRKAVWITFGVGFPVEKMTSAHLKEVFAGLRSAIATCSDLIPEVGV